MVGRTALLDKKLAKANIQQNLWQWLETPHKSAAWMNTFKASCERKPGSAAREIHTIDQGLVEP